MIRRTIPVMVLLLVASLTAVAPSLAQDESPPASSLVRLAGDGRAATAAAIAGQRDTADHVLIARQDSFPDALVGAVLAGALDAPILLAATDGLPEATADAIADLGASSATLLGGTAALGDAVETALRDLGLDVDRLAGDGRHATAAAIVRTAVAADPTIPGQVAGQRTALVASAAGFADALVGGAVAAGEGLPLLLVDADGVPEQTSTLVDELAIERLVVLGGTAVISEATVADLEALDVDVTRLAGDGRQATAAEVATWAMTALDWRPTAAVLATGDDFPDALAAAPLAGEVTAPVLLAGGDVASDALASALGCTVSTLYVAGGENAVSDEEAQSVLDAAATGDVCDLAVTAFPDVAVVPVGQAFTVTADLLDRDSSFAAVDLEGVEATFTVTPDTNSIGMATPTVGMETIPAAADGTAATTFTSNTPGLVVVNVCAAGPDGEETCDTSAVRFAARYAGSLDNMTGHANVIDDEVCLAGSPAEGIARIQISDGTTTFAVDGSEGCLPAHGLTARDIDADIDSWSMAINGAATDNFAAIGSDYGQFETTEAPAYDVNESTVSGVDHIATVPGTSGSTSVNFIDVDGVDVMATSGRFGLKLFDITDPTAPVALGTASMPGFWQNEDMDVDDSRDLIFLSRDPRAYGGSTSDGVAGVYIFDVSDPNNIVELAFHELPTGHTATCVLSESGPCDYLWSGGPATGDHQPEDWAGRPIFVTDITDPAKPFTYPQPLVTNQNDGVTDYAHDVQVDADGIAWVSSRGGIYGYHTMGTHTDPLTGEERVATPVDPVPYAGGTLADEAAPSRLVHNSFRAVGDTADQAADLEASGFAEGELIYNTEEAFSTRCETDGRFVIASLAGSEAGEGFESTPDDPFRLETVGIWSPTMAEGQSPDLFCSAHYFAVKDGIVAYSWYSQGTRFLDLSDPANPRQIAYSRPTGGVSYAPYFHGDYVIVADSSRGVEVLQLNDDAMTALAGEDEVLAPVLPGATFAQRQATGSAGTNAGAWEADPIFGWSCAIPVEETTSA